MKKIDVVWITCFYLVSSIAVSSTEIEEVKLLIQQQQYQEAYLLTDKIKLDYEGDPEFDYLYALSALESGHPDRAIFALERVIANQPKNQLARLELARAYYLNGEFSKSKTLFNLILDVSPPDNVKNNINLFLTKIDSFLNTSSYQTSAFTEFSLGWDNNINTASDETSVTIGNLVFKLNDNKKIAAAFAKLTAGGNYLKRVNKIDSFFIGGQVEKRDNFSENLDTEELSIRTGYLYINNQTRISIPLSYQKINLDDKNYRDLISISGEWSTFTNEMTYNSYIIQYGTISYPNQSSLDLQFINLGYTNNFIRDDKINLVNLSAFVGTEMPKVSGNEANMKDYLGLALNFSNANNLGLYSGLTTYNFIYHDKNPSFSKTRNDLLATAQIGYRWGLTKTSKLSSQIGYSKNNSNIDLYSYDRIIAEIKIRAEF